MRLNDVDLLWRVPPELEAIYARLENWARWARDRRKQGHCRSIEYRYKPEAGETWEGVEAAETHEPLDALEVNRIVREMPRKYRLILHYHHIHKLPSWVICRECVIPKRDYADERLRAWRMAGNRGDER